MLAPKVLSAEHDSVTDGVRIITLSDGTVRSPNGSGAVVSLGGRQGSGRVGPLSAGAVRIRALMGRQRGTKR